jgi:hypothetical protein
MGSPRLLLDRVELRVPEAARRTVDVLVAAVPAYGRLTREQLDGEVAALVEADLRLVLRCLREERAPSAAELGELRATAARRAEERVPLDQVLAASALGAQLLWRALVEEAGDAGAGDAVRLVDRLLQHLQHVVAAASQGYLEEGEALLGAEREARRHLTESLLTSGEAPPALLGWAGVAAAPRYRAVAIRLGPRPDEADPTVSGAVAGRRKVRRALECLEALEGGPALAVLDAGGGAAALAVADVATAHGALAEATGADVWLAASEPAPPAELPAAWRQARDVRRLVLALERPPGVYGVDDVLLERSVGADPAAAARLAALLGPLEEREDLLATLDTWFAVDFDRREAASRLTIHPNTLDHRLRRISELVGRDLATAAGTQLLGAALLARRLLR